MSYGEGATESNLCSGSLMIWEMVLIKFPDNCIFPLSMNTKFSTGSQSAIMQLRFEKMKSVSGQEYEILPVPKDSHAQYFHHFPLSSVPAKT